MCLFSMNVLEAREQPSPKGLVNPLCRSPCCTMHQPKENHMAETNRGRALPLLSPYNDKSQKYAKTKQVWNLQMLFFTFSVFLRIAFLNKMQSLGKTYVPHNCFHLFLLCLKGFMFFPHGVSCFPFFPFYPFPKKECLVHVRGWCCLFIYRMRRSASQK